MKDISSHVKNQKKSIKHPFFEYCEKNTTDPLWKVIFRDSSRGKFIKNLSVSETYINFRVGKEMKKLDIPPQTIEGIMLVKDFIKKNAGIYSENDLSISERSTTVHSDKKRRRRLEDITDNIDAYLSKFDKKERLDRKFALNMGLVLGILNIKDIVFNDEGEITTINGIADDGIHYICPEKFKGNKKTVKEKPRVILEEIYMKKICDNNDRYLKNIV